MLLMMISNRITHGTLAIQQARGLLRVLQQVEIINKNPQTHSQTQSNTQIIETTNQNQNGNGNSNSNGIGNQNQVKNGNNQINALERLHKELLTQGDNLAVTLAMKRNYTVQGPTQGLGQGKLI